ncbi:MAG: hypothetical protein ACRC5M_01305, partial [Anaeroplasmataceae bacterium]
NQDYDPNQPSNQLIQANSNANYDESQDYDYNPSYEQNQDYDPNQYSNQLIQANSNANYDESQDYDYNPSYEQNQDYDHNPFYEQNQDYNETTAFSKTENYDMNIEFYQNDNSEPILVCEENNLSSESEEYPYSYAQLTSSNKLSINQFAEEEVFSSFGESKNFKLYECCSEFRADISVESYSNIIFWGEVHDEHHTPISNVIITLLKVKNINGTCQYSKVLNTLTNVHGFYNFVVPRTDYNSEYEISISKYPTS